MGNNRGQLPPNRRQPLPARKDRADGLIRMSGRIPRRPGDTQSVIMSPGRERAPRGPR
jgi:hypothetical protein